MRLWTITRTFAALLAGLTLTTGCTKPAAQGAATSVDAGQDDGPAKTAYLGDSPGANRRYERGQPKAPPMIPHDVTGFLPIGTRNQCLNCHLNPAAALRTANIRVVPASHFVDRMGNSIANGPQPANEVYGGYYNCSTCHAPQADAAPLANNLVDEMR